MNTKTILATVALLALAGCSSTKIEGTGEFFQLQQRNVISRDLTRPVGVDNEPVTYRYSAFPQALK
ncbi:hypothetical protein V4W63_09730 [Pseudomonas aeruginosa]|uniref:hypothetical protein n=1 Tax=Pseudomonas aeruginosa TaxID=287 RepID=UPI0026F05CD9|nr:hypothetical protein [Pseudomonas aeruginosa]HBN8007351.1 hypothetical protein [Pseudomonas aeruginosa]HBO8052937.1 hypothetical protein [Pseudomonas aeruginosa]